MCCKLATTGFQEDRSAHCAIALGRWPKLKHSFCGETGNQFKRSFPLESLWTIEIYEKRERIISPLLSEDRFPNRDKLGVFFSNHCLKFDFFSAEVCLMWLDSLSFHERDDIIFEEPTIETTSPFVSGYLCPISSGSYHKLGKFETPETKKERESRGIILYLSFT